MMSLAADVRVNRMRQFGAFCRSVLPADAGQFLLLAGSYLLFISCEMPWWPGYATRETWWLWAGGSKPALTTSFTHWVLLSWVLRVVYWGAGAAGYSLFFWRAARSARRLVQWVILPASAGIAAAVCAAVFIYDISEGGLETSVFHIKRILPLLPLLAKGFGPGLHVAIAGVAMVGVAAWRVRRGVTHLPAGFAVPAEEKPGGDASVLRKFAWAMLALAAPLESVLILGGTPLLERVLWAFGKGRVPDYWIIEATEGSWRVLAAVPLAAIAVWLMGRERTKELARLLSPRRWGLLAFAVAIPLLVHWIPKILLLLAARIRWATYESPMLAAAPYPKDYLWPGRWQWDLLRFPAAALLSELAWRGFALRRFVARLGLHRGIVLLGVFWGAMYLRSDWLAVGGDAAVLLALPSSMLWGIALCYPLAWLTMRSDSVLPATLAMGASWMMPQMGTHEAVPVAGLLASPYVEVALWALVGVVLFRWFGVGATVQQTSQRPERT
jgi:Type II CAAX prenyl endopeptidase Rce1-like